jgi:hypothetical protein
VIPGADGGANLVLKRVIGVSWLPIAALLGWQTAAVAGVLNPLFVPGPPRCSRRRQR